MMVVVLAMCWMAGCGDDKSTSAKPEESDGLVGTWKLVSLSWLGETSSAADYSYGGLRQTVTFKADGTWSQTRGQKEKDAIELVGGAPIPLPGISLP